MFRSNSNKSYLSADIAHKQGTEFNLENLKKVYLFITLFLLLMLFSFYFNPFIALSCVRLEDKK